LVLSTAVLVACAPRSDTWERIQESGVLRVGLDPTYPPFEVTEGTDVVGLDVDIARALAQELGIRAEFVYFGYDGLYDALATEQVDVLASALVVVPGRMRDFAYSTPYYNAGEILIVPAGAKEIRGMADLSGRALAVELGAQGHVEATQWARRVVGLTIRPFPSAEEALTAVSEGKADAALLDSISGRLFLAEHPAAGLARLSDPVTVEPFALVTRIEDETLLARLDEALRNLDSDGRLGQLTARWLGE